MNSPRFAELGRQSRAPSPAKASTDAPTPELQETQPGGTPDNEKEREMADTVDKTSNDYLAGQTAGETAARKAERDRASAVMASEHFAGRAAMASKLLASDMSAEDIIDVLAAAPTATKAADDGKKPDDEDDVSQGREMLDQMKQQGNADLKNKSDDDNKSSRQKASSVWDRAAKANGRNPDKKEG